MLYCFILIHAQLAPYLQCMLAYIFLRILSTMVDGLNFLLILMHPAMATLVRMINTMTIETEMTETTTFLETNYRQT